VYRVDEDHHGATAAKHMRQSSMKYTAKSLDEVVVASSVLSADNNDGFVTAPQRQFVEIGFLNDNGEKEAECSSSVKIDSSFVADSLSRDIFHSKKCDVSALNHSGSHTKVISNYRPISVTCVTCKIFERVIANKIRHHLTVSGGLHPSQHDFTRGRSTCTTNLLESLNDWMLYFQDKLQVAIAYVDFSKAFDVVCHKKLFARLFSYGTRGVLLF